MATADLEMDTRTSDETYPMVCDFPQTNQDLHDRMTWLCNGPFSQRKCALIESNRRDFDRVIALEREIMGSLHGQTPLEAHITSEQVRKFTELAGILGGRVNGTGVWGRIQRLFAG